jgi:hypothetical protein
MMRVIESIIEDRLASVGARVDAVACSRSDDGLSILCTARRGEGKCARYVRAGLGFEDLHRGDGRALDDLVTRLRDKCAGSPLPTERDLSAPLC